MKQENQRKIYQTSWGREIVLEPNERLIDKLYEIFCADCPKAHRCHHGCCEFEDPYVCDNYYEAEELLEDIGESWENVW